MGNMEIRFCCLIYDVISCSVEDGEKQDKIKDVYSEHLEIEEPRKRKRRHGQKIEKPDAIMANFFKVLEVYQTKILVC